jgi:hypothetical protein
MPNCTGCAVTLNGSQMSGAGVTPTYTVTVLGDGNGAFSGITGFPLGTLAVFASSVMSGQCSGYTGIVSTGSGPITWNPTGYACTGMTDCRAVLSYTFTANPILSGFAPNYASYIHMFDSEGNSFVSTKATAGSPTVTTPQYTYYQPCGYSDMVFIDYRFMLPPYSGYVGARTVLNLNCGTCITV